MKTTKILYWVFTVLFALMMLVSALPDIVSTGSAVEMFNHLSLPAYLLPFLGVAKALGVIAILIPGYPRIKEWAFAGLFFDLVGATYCMSMSGEPAASYAFMALPIALGILAYVYYRKMESLPRSMPAEKMAAAIPG